MEELQFGELKYLIRYPKGYEAGKRYPVLFFMHGAGTRGSDIGLLKGNPFFGHIEAIEPPFVVVAPHCERDSWFDVFEQVIGLANHVFLAPFADQTRFYGTGNSMGGYGIWQLGMSCPQLFAAILPVCGGGMYWNAGRLKKVPVWAFHGDSDRVVSPEESKKMVAAVEKAGGDAKLTLYENCGHDAWTATYSNKAVYEWLLSHTKVEGKSQRVALEGSHLYG